MALNFRIPKLNDRELANALAHVRDRLHSQIELSLAVRVPITGAINVPEKKPEQNKQLKYIFDLNSNIADAVSLNAPTNQPALQVTRKPDEATDLATIPDDWLRQHGQPYQEKLPQIFANLLASARSELKAPELEATLKGAEDSAWNQYRDAQLAVTNSLQQATETLLIKASEKNAELDKDRAKRFEKLEVELRDQLQHERDKFRQEQEAKDVEHAERIKSFAEREAAFNTKEAGYVARQKQDEQIKQVKTWLENWNLTKGTTEKRRPIAYAYVTGIALSGLFAAYSIYHNYDLLKSADDIAKLLWWQWVAIALKATVPLAVFTTFLIYFIRWSSAWARQHAEEEFRNRSLLIDIGRSSWLLEAVRDAQARDKEIPVDLLHELSRNLYAYTSPPDTEIHPQAISDTLLHGLSSLRVKAPDGSEVEASRSKRK
jgi:hypothetical protein